MKATPHFRWMNVIFEMSDLKNASPSVVGRSGFLLMESRNLGWLVLRDSFMSAMPRDVYDSDKIACVRDLFDWLVPPCLAQVTASDTFLPYSEMHLVRT